MTTLQEQRLEILQALANVSLRMRKVGDWYVEQPIEVGGDGLLSGKYGNSATPELALDAHWLIYSTLKHPFYVVINAMTTYRRHLRWNGFMWAEVAQ